MKIWVAPMPRNYVEYMHTYFVSVLILVVISIPLQSNTKQGIYSCIDITRGKKVGRVCAAE